LFDSTFKSCTLQYYTLKKRGPGKSKLPPGEVELSILPRRNPSRSGCLTLNYSLSPSDAHMPRYSGAYRDSSGRVRPITAPVHRRGHRSKMPSSDRSLTTKQRNALPDSDFAMPERRAYPIENVSHARDALSRVSANGTAEEKAEVRRKVYERYPSIDSDRA
jgi:hypothetical protein